MNTSLKFPQDLLRFLYWVFFKPTTFRKNGILPNDDNAPNPTWLDFLSDWRTSKIRDVLLLSLVHILITPWLLGFLACLLLSSMGFPVNWFGMLIGIVSGMIICLWFGFFNIMDNVVFSISVSVSASLAFGALGSVSGIATGTLIGLGFGIAASVASIWGKGWSIFYIVMLGLAFGNSLGLESAFTFLCMYVAGYFRLPIYVVELLLTFLLLQLSKVASLRSKPLLDLSPIHWDELLRLPLSGLDSHLIAIGKDDRQTAQRAIADVTQFFHQQWAARNALIELTAYDVERAQHTQAIASIAKRFAWLPPTMPKELENVLPPIRDIAAYAQAALESDTLYNKQTQLRNAIAQTQRVREGLALSNNRQIAARFGRALETWEQVLGKELSGLDAREVIPNVYVAGSPLSTASNVFKGRHDLFVALERELTSQAEQRPTLLLFGARRSGKTSAIKQMPVRLGSDVIPVEVDLQSAATAEGARGLLFVIADQIKRNALTHRRVQLPPLTRDDLRADPYVVFRDWLNRVEDAVGARWILLNLDEYERLTEMMDAGRIDQRVFDFLRGIIQHHPRVTVLLSGSHTLEDLPPIWSDYLINVSVLKIENLKEDEARELIVSPIEDFPLQYEPAAVDRIIAATGCQPYLLQATGRDLVNALNERNRTTATLADADRALDSALTTGVAYFQELWAGRDTDDTQRAALRAIATQKVGAFHETPLQTALRKLVHRDILVATDGAYHFRVELVRRWVERSGS